MRGTMYTMYRNKESCKFENITWHNRYDDGGTIGIRIWHKRYSECGKNAERGKLGNAWGTLGTVYAMRHSRYLRLEMWHIMYTYILVARCYTKFSTKGMENAAQSHTGECD